MKRPAKVPRRDVTLEAMRGIVAEQRPALAAAAQKVTEPYRRAIAAHPHKEDRVGLEAAIRRPTISPESKKALTSALSAVYAAAIFKALDAYRTDAKLRLHVESPLRGASARQVSEARRVHEAPHPARVPVEKIVTRKRTVRKHTIKDFVRTPNLEPVDLVALADGDYYVRDGNHRVAAAIARKEPTVNALVNDSKRKRTSGAAGAEDGETYKAAAAVAAEEADLPADIRELLDSGRRWALAREADRRASAFVATWDKGLEEDLLDLVGKEPADLLAGLTEILDDWGDGSKVDYAMTQAALGGFQAGYQAALFSDGGKKVSPYWTFVTTSGNPCDTCNELEGMVFEKDDDAGMQFLPPLHPNCQCDALDADPETPDDEIENAKDVELDTMPSWDRGGFAGDATSLDGYDAAGVIGLPFGANLTAPGESRETKMAKPNHAAAGTFASAKPTTVQTLIFDKDKFKTAGAAQAWARDHDYKAPKVDETGDSFRLRQRDPGDFDDGSFRTIELTSGVKAVIGHLKGAKAAAEPVSFMLFSAFTASLPDLDAEGKPPIVIERGIKYVVGKPMHVFPLGDWTATDERLFRMSEAHASRLVEAQNDLGFDISLTYDHEHDVAKGSKSAGLLGDFEVRDDGLWAKRVRYTLPFYDELSKGEWTYVSGDAMPADDSGDGYSDPFIPGLLLAVSTVPKPALGAGLQALTLSHRSETKENKMTIPAKFKAMVDKFRTDEALCLRFGVDPAASTDDQILEAIMKMMDEPDGDEPEANGKKPVGLAADPKTDAPAGDDKEADAKLAVAVGEKFAALAADSKFIERFTAAVEGPISKKAAEAWDARKKAADEAKAIDDELIAFEKSGQLATAEREIWRGQFAAGGEVAEKARGILKARTPALSEKERRALETPSVTKVSLLAGERASEAVGRLPKEERDEVISQALRWAHEAGLGSCAEQHVMEVALDNVFEGKNAEFEARIRTWRSGGKVREYFRPSLRKMELDLDVMKAVRANMDKGSLRGLIPDSIQRWATQRFATIDSVKSLARAELPMGLGFYQAPGIGNEILPNFVGGPDMKAEWTEYGMELVAPSGIPVGLNSMQIPERDLAVIKHSVDLVPYSERINVDRILRDMAATLPEAIEVTAARYVTTLIETNREKKQADFVRSTGNYATNNHTSLTTGSYWSDEGSIATFAGKPISDLITGMTTVFDLVGSYPDLCWMSNTAFMMARKNAQILAAFIGQGTFAKPNALVPIEALIAILGVSVVVGGARYSAFPGGDSASAIWGKDAGLVCTGEGRIIAPRFGATAVGAGYPFSWTFPRPERGGKGSDAVQVTDAFKVFGVSTSSGYLIQQAGGPNS